ncbi:GntR family transcriptional regulator [Streptomyces sp. NBC_01506]|uniref:GntR family transcriptional regulator n=1 Tax=Streptomyces sp. NBC_01506 TaxID=2903887 RepID=UPI00386F4867
MVTQRPATPQTAKTAKTPEGSDSAERVAAGIRTRIMGGELPSGTPLRESTLAADLGVSRNTLREGLRALVAEGLVTQELYKGAVVATITAEQVRDIYRARRVLELQAVNASALRSDAEVGCLATGVVEAEQAATAQRWRDVGTASLHFHQALVGLLASPLCDDFFRLLAAQLRLAWGAARDEREFQCTWPERDRDLYTLLRTGYVAHARGVLSEYLDDSEAQVLAALRTATRS